ncbi:MAG: hypothetical protein AMXMBFR83_04420 [Phycisphaerae bacterium]
MGRSTVRDHGDEGRRARGEGPRPDRFDERRRPAIRNPKSEIRNPPPLALVLGVALAAAFSDGPIQAQSTRPAIAGRRIVKHFDFNETPLGNYESTPMFWRRRAGAGFSLFLEGKFDYQVYHTAAPSFRLDLDGGSLAYEYLGGDIAVRTHSDYLVSAWVRASGLTSARAYLTACYLDRRKNPIPGTQRRSPLIGGPGSSAEFQPVTIGLPGHEPNARYIGIGLWLAQERVWNTGPRLPRGVDHEDVSGSAWFDDVTVCRLPRVTLSSAAPGQVFAGDVQLLAEVGDPDGLNLAARLIVRDAQGGLIRQDAVPVQSLEEAGRAAFEYRDLPVGLYRAELLVDTEGVPLIRRELSFLRVAGQVSRPASIGRGFGVILADADPGALNAQLDLIRDLGAEFVKLPVWSVEDAASGNAEKDSVVARYLQAIVESRADPVGILTDPPSSGQASPIGRVRSMLDLFSEDPAGWRPLIAGVWSRHAGLIHVWQIGGDGDAGLAGDERLAEVVPALRREMAGLVGDPLLATTTRLGEAEPTRSPGDYLSLVLPADLPVESIADYLSPRVAGDPGHTWITVEPPTADAYSPELRLADLARRLVEATWQAPGAVFLAAPWSPRDDGAAVGLELTEDYLVLRTAADVLGDARPVSRLDLDGGARGILFDRGGRAVLFAWDPAAGPAGREHVLPLGDEARQIDLRGRELPVGHAGRQRVVKVGPLPTFILDAPTWLLDFRRHFAVQPAILESSLEPAEPVIHFRNTSNQPIAGTLRLVAPPDWDVRPPRMTFALQPGQEFRRPISLRFPLNAPAGPTPLVGEFEIDADQRHRFLVPAWFELGLRDVELDGYTYRSGDALMICLQITNRGRSPLHFEARLLAPGRDPIERLLANLPPGQLMTKTFQLDDADKLSGRYVRLALKEIRGSRIWNRMFQVP